MPLQAIDLNQGVDSPVDAKNILKSRLRPRVVIENACRFNPPPQQALSDSDDDDDSLDGDFVCYQDNATPVKSEPYIRPVIAKKEEEEVVAIPTEWQVPLAAALSQSPSKTNAVTSPSVSVVGRRKRESPSFLSGFCGGIFSSCRN